MITLVRGQHNIQSSHWLVNQVLKYCCSSIFNREAAVFVPKDIVLTQISSRCPRVVGPGKDFLAMWIPAGLKSGLWP